MEPEIWISILDFLRDEQRAAKADERVWGGGGRESSAQEDEVGPLPPVRPETDSGPRRTVQRGPTTTAPYVPPPSKPAPPSGANKAAIDIAAKRAEIQAKLAAMRSKMGAPPSASTPVASGSGSASAGRGIVGPGVVKSNLDPDLARKVADAKRMVESMQAKSRLSNAGSSNPYLVRVASAVWILADWYRRAVWSSRRNRWLILR